LKERQLQAVTAGIFRKRDLKLWHSLACHRILILSDLGQEKPFFTCTYILHFIFPYLHKFPFLILSANTITLKNNLSAFFYDNLSETVIANLTFF